LVLGLRKYTEKDEQDEQSKPVIPYASRVEEAQVKRLLEHLENMPTQEEDNLEKYITGEFQEERTEEEIILEVKQTATEDGISKMEEILEEFNEAKPIKPNINDFYDKPFFDITKAVLKYVAIIVVNPKVEGFKSQMDLFEKTADILIEENHETGASEGVNRGYEDTMLMENLENQVHDILVSEKEDEIVEKGEEKGIEEVEANEKKMMEEVIDFSNEKESEEGNEELNEELSSNLKGKKLEGEGGKMYKKIRKIRDNQEAQKLKDKITEVYAPGGLK
jgi:hypothetical protein